MNLGFFSVDFGGTCQLDCRRAKKVTSGQRQEVQRRKQVAERRAQRQSTQDAMMRGAHDLAKKLVDYATERFNESGIGGGAAT